MKRMSAAIAASLLLSGCVASYVHLDAPLGVMTLQSCAGGGPPVLARYERKGATFDVTMEPRESSRSRKGFLRVRAPEGVVVKMPDPGAYLKLDAGGPPLRFTLRLAEVRRVAGRVERRFDFEGLPERIDFEGTLHLPEVLVGDAEVISPLFRFHREPFVGRPGGDC